MKEENGFSLAEVLVALVLLSATVWGIYEIITEINNADRLVLEANYADQLIEVYLESYEEMEVTEDNVTDVMSNLQYEDLGQKYADSVPDSLDGLRVMCRNSPQMIEGGEYIQMEFECTLDGRQIAQGKTFTLNKYIH